MRHQTPLELYTLMLKQLGHTEEEGLPKNDGRRVKNDGRARNNGRLSNNGNARNNGRANNNGIALLSYMPARLPEITVRNLLHKQVEPEDLAPLVYIHQRLHGIDKEQIFDHIVIDEAQDFSPFQVAVLKRQSKLDSFTILGDLSQGIHSYQGITSWQELKEVFASPSITYVQLEQSYRSTMEIIEFANRIISKVDQPEVLAKPVFRSGEKVKLIRTSHSGHQHDRPAERIVHCLRTLQQQDDVQTIAMIGRTAAACRQMYDALQEEGIEATLITPEQRQYEGGISVIPIYLTKGLEFDAVLIVDVDEDHYRLTAQDAKLLYVGCTRALHTLWLLYNGNPSPLLPAAAEDEDAEVYTRESLESL
jgi:DNA helicase II / ATP-dependent DNA helicase PcrA